MRPRIAIIGAGFGGLCMAIALRRAGFHDFFLIEKEDAVGGTWRDNIYPGAACDIASFMYCFSFDPKRDWTRKWASQDEIRSYIDRLVVKHGLIPRIRLGVELTAAKYDNGHWHLALENRRTNTESHEIVDVLITSVGQLNRPKMPAIPGLETFTGEAFHSARWKPSFDPRKKRIAMIGTGASAIQIVPEIAPLAEKLILFQRSPNWILPKNDRVYSKLEQTLFKNVPAVASLYRHWLWLYYELHYPAIRGHRLVNWYALQQVKGHLQAQVSNPELRKKLTPNYPVAAKRILISDDYYPAVSRANVRLLAESPKAFDSHAIVDQNNERHEIDAVVFATGFETTSFLAPMEIKGASGKALHDCWRDGAEAYLGMRVAGFPNFFMMYGPNTNLGHNSILFMLECQARYIIDCLGLAGEKGDFASDITENAHRHYNVWLQNDLARTVWAKVERSWYMTQTGKITNNWPRSTTEYWLRTRRVIRKHVDLYPLRR